MIPESAFVSVSVSVSQAAASQNGFGLVCHFGTSTILPSGQRYSLFSDLVSVGAVFPTTTNEYKAAQVHFSASPKPAQLMIARMFNTAVPAELIGGLADTVLAHYTGIANGALRFTIDGTLETVTAIDLTAAASLVQVATAIQTALDAVKAGFTVSYANGQFILRSGTTGTASTLTFATAPGAGTDLSPLMALRSTDGGVLTQGQNVETVTQSLDNVTQLFSSYYQLMLVDAPSDADVEALAAWALANDRIAGYVTSNGGALNSGTTDDIGSVLMASTNDHVIGMFDLTTLNPFAIAGALACGATVDFNGKNTAKILMFKKLGGVGISDVSTAQRQVLDSKHYNYYVSVGSNPMFAKGVMADGSWYDQVMGLDWLRFSLQDVGFSSLYGANKVPQTDKGMSFVLHRIDNFMNTAVNNGLLAPGVWNSAPIDGVVNTGEYVAKGYKLFADSVDNQTQVQRETRIGPPITIIAKGAGALQGLDILLNFEQ